MGLSLATLAALSKRTVRQIACQTTVLTPALAVSNIPWLSRANARMIKVDCSRLLKARLQLRVFETVHTRHFAVTNLWILDDPATVYTQVRGGELLLVAWQRDAEDCSDGC